MSLLEKILKIEALIQRASSEGEREAARLAKERLSSQLAKQQAETPVEYRFSFDCYWKKRLFMSLCKKHGFSTYRYPRQRYTTACLRIPESMLREVLQPEFRRYAKMLEELVEEIMKDLTNQIHETNEEEMVIGGHIGFSGDAPQNDPEIPNAQDQLSPHTCSA
jgi:hypothetical protein